MIRRAIRTRRLLALAASVAAVAAGLVPVGEAARAHIAVDDDGRFRHQVHSGRLTVWNDVDDRAWRRATRRAQINWDKTMSPVFEFDTARSLRSAIVHVLDGDYGDTGWIGYADGWGYNAGHGHPRLHLHYRRRKTADYLQKVARHESSLHRSRAQRRRERLHEEGAELRLAPGRRGARTAATHGLEHDGSLSRSTHDLEEEQ